MDDMLYKCPKCGEDMEIGSKMKEVECPYCGSEIPVDQSRLRHSPNARKKAIIEWVIIIYGVAAFSGITIMFFTGFDIAYELTLCEEFYEKVMIMIMIMLPGMVFGGLPAGYYVIEGIQKLTRDALKLLIFPPLGIALLSLCITIAGVFGIFCLPYLLIKRIFGLKGK